MSDTAVRAIRVADAAPRNAGFIPASFARIDRRASGDATALSAQVGRDQRPALDDFARGFEEGHRAADEAFSTERAALLRLVESVSALQPEPSEELAMLIGETVYRLVTDIVGQIDIDRDCLSRRATAAAGLVAECDNARTLNVNPADLVLLEDLRTDLTLAGDASLARGDVRIDCSAGWIEHGTSLYIDALRSELGLAEAGA